MKMNKTVAAVAAGMIAFGAFFSTSAAGIGYVDTNAALQSHPKMQKAHLDMTQAVQKAQENFEKRSQGKSDQEKQQIMTEIQKKLTRKKAPPCSRSSMMSEKPSSRFVRKKASTSFWNRGQSLTAV